MKITEIDIKKITKIYNNNLKQYEYPNPKRLEKIFEFWLISYLKLKEIGVTPDRKVLNIYLWYMNFLGLDVERSNKKEKKNLIRNFLKYLSKITFFNTGLLPGGQKDPNSIFDKLKMIIMKNILEDIETSLNQDLKKSFFSDLSQFLNIKIIEDLDFSLPDFFFFKIINSKLPNKYRGSMSIIFEDPFNKIFFQKQSPYIAGLAHGAFYGEYKFNMFEKLEKDISNEFFGFGLDNKNIIQNRFNAIAPKSKNVNNIFIMCAAPLNYLLENYFQGINIITNDANLFTEEINKEITIKYLRHPSESMLNKSSNPENIFFSDLNKDIIDDSLFIIDRPGHTFLYKCIYEGLPFIMIFNDEWKQYFKPKYIEFLAMLRKNELLFWYSEKDLFFNKLKSYSNDKIFRESKFTKVRNFLEQN